jgi:flavin reductase (DIM6/NTAB) family NADH-FMN oxidoreductase RutF
MIVEAAYAAAMRVAVPLDQSWRLLNHGPTTLISTAHQALVEGCAAWLECRVLPEPDLQERYDLFVLECIAAWADDALWQRGEWQFTASGPRTIHHCKGGVFYATGERLAAPRS